MNEDTYCFKVGLGQFRERHVSQLRAREPDIPRKHVPLDYMPPSPIRTTTMLSRTITLSNSFLPSVRMPQRLE